MLPSISFCSELPRLTQTHSGDGEVLSPSMPSAQLWVSSPHAVPLTNQENLLHNMKEADPIPDWISALPLHWELLGAPCVGARLWRHSQRWGAGREGFPLVFQAVFVRIGHGRLQLLLPGRFCGSLGGQGARSWEGEHSPACCTPHAECTQIKARAHL